MSDVPEFYHYLEQVGVKIALSCKDWTLWSPDFREVILP